jgi:RNA polymerase sigma-70 factor (ECF subfamily)
MHPRRDRSTTDDHVQAPASAGRADAAHGAGWATDAMRRRLVAFATRYVGDAWEAEDVVQDTLLRARESLPGLRARERGEAWLFRICRHAAIDHVRSRHVRRSVWQPLPVVEPPASGKRSSTARAGGDPTERAGRGPDEARGHPRTLPLRTLPAHQRVLVSLHYEHGMSQALLCRMTGLSPSALRVRLFRARNALLAASRARARD